MLQENEPYQCDEHHFVGFKIDSTNPNFCAQKNAIAANAVKNGCGCLPSTTHKCALDDSKKSVLNGCYWCSAVDLAFVKENLNGTAANDYGCEACYECIKEKCAAGSNNITLPQKNGGDGRECSASADWHECLTYFDRYPDDCNVTECQDACMRSKGP
jgi:hypothetical protein